MTDAYIQHPPAGEVGVPSLQQHSDAMATYFPSDERRKEFDYKPYLGIPELSNPRSRIFELITLRLKWDTNTRNSDWNVPNSGATLKLRSTEIKKLIVVLYLLVLSISVDYSKN